MTVGKISFAQFTRCLLDDSASYHSFSEFSSKNCLLYLSFCDNNYSEFSARRYGCLGNNAATKTFEIIKKIFEEFFFNQKILTKMLTRQQFFIHFTQIDLGKVNTI